MALALRLQYWLAIGQEPRNRCTALAHLWQEGASNSNAESVFIACSYRRLQNP